MKKLAINSTFFEYDSVNELSQEERELINHSKDAVKNAYAPYSKFKVGAAILLESGKIVTGTNQENAAYSSGICAERVAVFYANSMFPGIAIKAIAISAFANNDFIEKPISPCGTCRQVITETETRFKHPVKIYLVGKHKIIVIESAALLLPLQFDEAFLNEEP